MRRFYRGLEPSPSVRASLEGDYQGEKVWFTWKGLFRRGSLHRPVTDRGHGTATASGEADDLFSPYGYRLWSG